MPYRDSNMPNKIFYAAVEYEVLRLARTTCSKEKLQKLIATFLTRIHR